VEPGGGENGIHMGLEWRKWKPHRFGGGESGIHRISWGENGIYSVSCKGGGIVPAKSHEIWNNSWHRSIYYCCD
jgi:hypothetical protein